MTTLLKEWARPSWWRFVLTGQICCGSHVYPGRARYGWRQFICRWRGHPAGPNWFVSDPEAIEPDMRCRNCGDYIG